MRGRVALLSFLLCLGLLVSAQGADGNLVVNPGLESGEQFDWRASSASVERVRTNPHSGEWCLYVKDTSGSRGQGNSRNFPVPPGRYYVEAWVRVDPDLPGVITFDAQFYTAGGTYIRDRQSMGQTDSTEWTLLSGVVVVPLRAGTVTLRVMPTGPAPGATVPVNQLHGACFVDDFYFVPIAKAVEEGRMGSKRQVLACANEDPEGLVGEVPPDIVGKPMTPKAQIDFEDLTGWSMEIYGGLNASFVRSREQQAGGRYVGKLTYATEGKSGWVVLRPPEPLPLPADADALQVWCFGDSYEPKYRGSSVSRMSVTIVEDGVERSIRLRPFGWSYWSIAHQRLDQLVAPGAKLTEIRIDSLSTDLGDSRKLFLDELSFFVRKPPEKFDLAIPDIPAPTRPETILPAFKSPYRNSVAKQGDVFVLTYQGDDERIEYRYKPQTGGMDDLEVTIDGEMTFQPAAGGGPVLAFGDKEYRVGDEDLKAQLVECKLEGDDVRAVWRYSAGDQSATISSTLRIAGKSVILTLDESDGKVSKWVFGNPPEDRTREIGVLFMSLTRSNSLPGVQLVNEKAFVFCQPDWYVTHASKFTQDGCSYVPPFRGSRVPLHERLFLTVSSDFQEVLPTIANPKARYAHVLGENVYLAMPRVSAWKNCLVLLRQMKGLGMEKCIVFHHADTWSAHGGRGNEPFTMSSRAAANIPGGDAGLGEYGREVRALGFEFFVYTTYWAFSPVNRSFDPDLVALDPDGQWIYNWYQYRLMTPLMAPVVAARIAPQIKAKYGITGSYCDVHTAGAPWGFVDYDPRKPGAAMLQTVFRAYAKVFEVEREAYEGPVVSEGHRYWYYAGLTDGNYARPPGSDPWKLPFLVDFALLKLHPLEVDIGMGYGRAEYRYDDHAKNVDDALDRFLCAVIAFGHSGVRYRRWSPSVDRDLEKFDPDNPLAEKKRVVARTYFMIQQLAKRYALVPVRSIAYWNGEKLVDTSEAIRSDAVKRSQVAVEYENGLRVFANGSLEHSWRVEANGETYELPPNGWLAMQGEDFLEYSAIRDGHRVDYVRSPVYTFADGRGVATDFGDVKATNAVIILHGRGGERHEIDTPMDY